MKRFTLDLDNPPSLTAEEAAALDSLTPEEIEENARNDPDNPPMTPDELERLMLARTVQQIREASGLTRQEFALRYQIDPARLEMFERGLLRPDSAVVAYLKTIHSEPEAVARALAASWAA